MDYLRKWNDYKWGDYQFALDGFDINGNYHFCLIATRIKELDLS